VVTYASSASGTVRSKDRDLTPLLSRWRETPSVPTRELPSALGNEQSQVPAIGGLV
jgi:hypothetical protein